MSSEQWKISCREILFLVDFIKKQRLSWEYSVISRQKTGKRWKSWKSR
jgi:hypothetical protein